MSKAKSDIGLLLKIRRLREDRAARNLAAAEAQVMRASQEEIAAGEAVGAVAQQVDAARRRNVPADEAYVTGATLKVMAENIRTFKVALLDARIQLDAAKVTAFRARQAYAEHLSEYRRRQVSVIKTEATLDAILHESTDVK